MSIFKRKNIIAFMAFALILALVIPAYADITDSDIENAMAVKAEEEQKLASTEERVNELEKLKGDNEAYLNELSSQLEELSARLEEAKTHCAEKKSELETVRAELAQQRELAEQQYEDMKVRIQYMYEETSNSGILESLFSAESFSEFINRAETMSEINRYDRDMLNSYTETISTIEKKEQEIIKEQEELTALEEQLTAQMTQVQEIYETTYNDLRACEEEINENEAAHMEMVAQIRRQQESIDNLLAMAYAEEAARRAEEEALAASKAAASGGQEYVQAAQEVPYEAGYETVGWTEETYTEQNTGESYSEETASEAVPEAVTETLPETGTEALPDNGEAYQEESAEESTGETPASEPEEQAEEQASQTEGGTYLGNFTLTAYCGCASCCGQWASATPTTASGAPCVEGVTVAMGGVPFGTQLLINGNVYTVQDRGTAYGHVDIYFADHSSALAFGLQHADVYQLN